ncbi:MAG TPA: glycosyltransferase 87 family protein [Sphingomicrobium sp.]|nr:glycosyltransferase 87 family protein [Sphingomicrobium sp.]
MLGGPRLRGGERLLDWGSEGGAGVDKWQRVGPGRIPLVLWGALFAFNALPWLIFSINDMLALDDRFVSRAGMLWGRDFSNHWFGGTFALQGMNVYDNAAYQEAIRGYGAIGFQNYSYPPHTLLLGVILALLPYPLALFLWVVGGSWLFYRAAKPFVPFSPWLVLLVPAVARIPYGQFGLLTSALFLFSMRGSGVAAGLLTMKPHLGIMLAAAMLVKRRFRQIAVAVGVTLALLLLAEAWFGLGRSFLDEGLKTQATVLFNKVDAPYFGVMPSAYVALRHTGLEWIGQAVAASCALLIMWQFRSAELKDMAFPAATATFIVLPYSFAYDMALVSVGFAVILYCHWCGLGWAQRAIAILAFSTPNLVPTGLVPLILLAGLWLQLTVWRRESSAPSSADRMKNPPGAAPILEAVT